MPPPAPRTFVRTLESTLHEQGVVSVTVSDDWGVTFRFEGAPAHRESASTPASPAAVSSASGRRIGSIRTRAVDSSTVIKGSSLESVLVYGEYVEHEGADRRRKHVLRADL